MKITTIPLTVTTAGTPQQFTTDDTIRGFRIDFFPKVGNTKRSVVGIAAMVKATLVNCIRELGAVTADTNPSGHSIEDGGAGGGNQLKASDFWGDVDASNEIILMVVYTK